MTLIDGMKHGVIATTVMSAVMVAGDKAGLLGEPPPTTITREVLDQAAADDPTVVAILAPVAHLAFGAVGGGLFVPIRRGLPGPGWLLGILYALGIWVLSYRGWIPALGILPPPERDRPGRPAVMVAAHVVYGLLLGWLAGPRRG